MAAASSDNGSVHKDILNVGLSEFANYGFAGTRIEAIAARTKTSKRMIYYHFSSKEGLYKAVLDYAYRIVREPEPVEFPPDLPALECLSLMVAQAFENFCTYPDFIRLTLQENLQGARFLREMPDIALLNQSGVRRVEEILQKGRQEGTVRPGLSAMDVYINFVGLCVYHISAKNSYQALFGYDFTDQAVADSRKASVCDAVLRYVRA